MAISFGLMGDLAIGVAGAFVGGLPFQQIPAPSGSGVISAMIDATISAHWCFTDHEAGSGWK
jgi:uncharacterized membrane protein YeaQ/YmgE (transglycosylase-associated protein family)